MVHACAVPEAPGRQRAGHLKGAGDLQGRRKKAEEDTIVETSGAPETRAHYAWRLVHHRAPARSHHHAQPGHPSLSPEEPPASAGGGLGAVLVVWLIVMLGAVGA